MRKKNENYSENMNPVSVIGMKLFDKPTYNTVFTDTKMQPSKKKTIKNSKIDSGSL
ncbi:hypothetical protein BB561_005139 [Smittium simulii]|uniref:Uncharacterized protein n=1 Tax=Smittium simulii TaxID=133385 RepID=A0A2T9YBZ2_9FUNG|nr:hypothetical protein BB561_005139 [Smittium simulii]